MKKGLFSLILVALLSALYAKDPKELYIDLIKNVLANTIYEDPSFTGPYDSGKRSDGLDHPRSAHTMVGLKRLDNIHFCLREIIEKNIPGDCIETGVWRGGSTILMRAILKAYNDTERKVWVADSFEGLPPPNIIRYPADFGLDFYKSPYLAVSLEEVKKNFEKYELLDQQVIFLKGFFRDTLPQAPIERISLLRLDGDLYESTMDALLHLYPKLSKGGYVIIDDYGEIEACAKAVNDYRVRMGIREQILWADQSGIYWKKNTD